jgi:site-specific recombinase XerD
VAQSTLDTFSSHVRRLLPLLGQDTQLADITNKTLKDLVGKLVAEDLAPKTIGELIATTKSIVASAVSDEGEQLFPRTSNHEFLDLPTISKPKQPCATTEDVERAIKNATSHQEQLLYAVLSGAGLRIAEALGIHVSGADDQTSWDAATATITVRSSKACRGSGSAVERSDRQVRCGTELSAGFFPVPVDDWSRDASAHGNGATEKSQASTASGASV